MTTLQLLSLGSNYSEAEGFIFVVQELFWKCFSSYSSFTVFLSSPQTWIWLSWFISQCWITVHLWTPKHERLARSEKWDTATTNHFYLNLFYVIFHLLLQKSASLRHYTTKIGYLREYWGLIVRSVKIETIEISRSFDIVNGPSFIRTFNITGRTATLPGLGVSRTFIR